MARFNFTVLVCFLASAVSVLSDTEVSSNCYRKLKNPLPSGRVCGGPRGTLRNPQLIGTFKIPMQPSEGTFELYREYCSDQCLEYDGPCGSFSVDPATATCRLFRQTLETGFTKKQTTLGPRFYENVCFEYSCFTSVETVLTDGASTYDDERFLITLPFTIPFGSLTTNQLWMSVNGFVSIGPDDPSSAYTNTNFPTSALPPNAIAVFWDDLAINNDEDRNLGFEQKLSYRYSRSEAEFIWAVYPRNGVAGSHVRVKLQITGYSYNYIIYEFVDSSKGNTATVGMQTGGNFNTSSTYSYNTASIEDGLVLLVTESKVCRLTDPTCF